MDRKLFGFFSSTQITTLIGLAILAPTTLGAVTAFTNVALQDPSTGARAGISPLGDLQTQALPVPGHASFFSQAYFYGFGSAYPVIPPTTAAVAIDTISLENYFDQTNGAKARVTLSLNFSDDPTTCNNNAGSQTMGVFEVGPGETVHLPFPNGGLVLQRKAANPWCLSATSTLQGNPSTQYPVSISYSGYVVSGSFTAPASARTSANGLPPLKR